MTDIKSKQGRDELREVCDSLVSKTLAANISVEEWSNIASPQTVLALLEHVDELEDKVNVALCHTHGNELDSCLRLFKAIEDGRYIKGEQE